MKRVTGAQMVGAKRGGSGSWSVLVVASALCAVTPAYAAKPGQAFRLEYWASGSCPDALEFARQIQTRAPRLRPAEAAEPALGFYAELVERKGGVTGRLTARSPDGREVVREVRGPTCADVVTALALIAALAADPNQPVESAPVVHSAEPLRRVERPVDRDEQADLSAELQAEDSRAARERRWTFGVGVGLGFDSSIAPSPGYGLGIGFDAEAPGGSPLRPLFALSANRASAANTETSGVSASFTWVAFRLAGCPLRLPEGTPLFVRPCAFLDAGVLAAEIALPRNMDESKAWVAAGGFLRIEALTAEVVSFQLDGGLSVPLLRPAFGVGEGAPPAFRVPTSGILGRIGLSYHFQ